MGQGHDNVVLTIKFLQLLLAGKIGRTTFFGGPAANDRILNDGSVSHRTYQLARERDALHFFQLIRRTRI